MPAFEGKWRQAGRLPGERESNAARSVVDPVLPAVSVDVIVAAVASAVTIHVRIAPVASAVAVDVLIPGIRDMISIAIPVATISPSVAVDIIVVSVGDSVPIDIVTPAVMPGTIVPVVVIQIVVRRVVGTISGMRRNSR